MIPRLSRLRSISRRDVLWAGAGMVVGGGILGQGVVDPIMEPVASRVSEALYGAEHETIDPTSMDQTAARLPSMAGNAIADARDIAAETGGLNELWWERARRAGVLKYATRVKRRDDGKLIIADHGGGLVLWGEDAPERMRGVPLDEQPDRKFGRFADRCMWEAMQRRAPALHARRAETTIKGHDRPQIIEYYAWTLSDGAEAVSVALTLDQVARARTPERSHPGIAGARPHLPSIDATTPYRTSRLASLPDRSAAP